MPLEKIRVMPRTPQMRVPKPDGSGNLKTEGEEVERSGYWLRRLRDQDVKLVARTKTSGKSQPANEEK